MMEKRYENERGEQIRVKYPVNFAVSPYVFAIGDDEALNLFADIVESAGDEVFKSIRDHCDRETATKESAKFVENMFLTCGFGVVR